MRELYRSIASLWVVEICHIACFVAFVLVVMLAGCSNSSTHGTEKELDVKVTINNNGDGEVNITSPLTLDSASETAQDTANKATTSPTTRLQLTEGGSTAAGEGSDLKDVASSLKQKLQSDNKTETKTSSTTDKKGEESADADKEENVLDQIDQGKEEASEDLDFKNKAIYTSYGVRNGGRQAWRIPKKGPEFGKTAKAVFSNGDSFVVPDTSKNCRDNQETCERDKSSKMYGFVFKPGIGPNGEGDDDTGTSHGGVYLHAPYGNGSKQVTFYYNAP